MNTKRPVTDTRRRPALRWIDVLVRFLLPAGLLAMSMLGASANSARLPIGLF